MRLHQSCLIRTCQSVQPVNLEDKQVDQHLGKQYPLLKTELEFHLLIKQTQDNSCLLTILFAPLGAGPSRDVG